MIALLHIIFIQKEIHCPVLSPLFSNKQFRIITVLRCSMRAQIVRGKGKNRENQAEGGNKSTLKITKAEQF